MKKLFSTLLVGLISLSVFAQVPDRTVTNPVPLTGVNKNKQSDRYSNITAVNNLRIPVASTFTLNNAKDSVGYVMFNSVTKQFGVYKGNGMWDVMSVVADGLISVGDITVSGNTLTVVAPVFWRINATNQEKLTNTVFNVPSATDGYNRIDLIYATNAGTILKIQGTETMGVAVEPVLPANSIKVAPVYITGSQIQQPLPDLNVYYTKSEIDVKLTGKAPISPTGTYIQGSPSSPQSEFIDVSGNVISRGLVRADNGFSLNGTYVLKLNSGFLDLGESSIPLKLNGLSVNIPTNPSSGTSSDAVLVRATDGTVKSVAQSSISPDLTPYQLRSEKGVANGYTPLGADSKVSPEYLPTGAQIYKGTWDASTNTPTLADGVGTVGWTYRVVTGGTQNLGSGNITFAMGDDAIYNGTVWQRNPSSVDVTNLVTTNTVQTITGAKTFNNNVVFTGATNVNSNTYFFKATGGNGANSSSAGTAVAQNGSIFNIKAGNGGIANGTGFNIAGQGGDILLTAGDGGVSSGGSNNTDGVGGSATLQAGTSLGNSGGGATYIKAGNSNLGLGGNLYLINGWGNSNPSDDEKAGAVILNATESVVRGQTLIGKLAGDNNRIDRLQVNGTISASPATLPTQVIIKSQIDAGSEIGANAASASSVPFSGITGKPTTLSGYGITDAYPLTGNPSGFLTTETDPTVPAYAKSLTAFSVIKSSTDALYEPLIGTKNTAFNRNFGTTANTVTEGNDSRVLNGQTAFGWGNHAVAGYITASSANTLTNKSGNISQWTNNAGYITSASLPDLTPYALKDGTNSTGTWSINTTGNAGTVTNGVYTSGSYANPSWITSLAYSKLTGTPTIPTNNNQLTNGAGYITEARIATGQTIGANTTGNANTATAWGGNTANFTSEAGAIDALVGFESGVAKYVGATKTKAFLNTTLQDVTTAGNTTNTGATFGGNVTSKQFILNDEGGYLSNTSSLYNNGNNGLQIITKAGNINDFQVANSAGQGVLQIPTGTRNVSFDGNINVGGVSGLTLTNVTPYNLNTDVNGLNFSETNIATRLFVQKTTGNVGIGTTSPNSKLHVAGAGQIDTDLNFGYSGQTNNIGSREVGQTLNVNGSQDLNLRTYNNGWNSNLYVNNIGNIGIGTTSPSAKLDVNGTGQFINGNNGRINVGATTNYLYGDNLGNIILGNSGGDRLQILPNGSVRTSANDGNANTLVRNTDLSNTILNQTSTDQSAGFRINGSGSFRSSTVRSEVSSSGYSNLNTDSGSPFNGYQNSLAWTGLRFFQGTGKFGNLTANTLTGSQGWQLPDESGEIALKPFINNSITTTQTSSSLNSLYPSVSVGTLVIAPNVGTGMEYRKVNSTGGGQWRAVASTSI